MKLTSVLVPVIACLLMTPVFAIDFEATIKNSDGTPVTDKDGVPLIKQPTLGSLCESALFAQYADERDATGKETITPEEKFSRWKLSTKLHGNNVTLSAEELALLKKFVGKAYGPLVVGQAWTLLDPGAK